MPDSLPKIDYDLWHLEWGRRQTPGGKEALLSALGGYLGTLLVRHLGGRWVPRNRLAETAVIIGNRAWLPFLRAHHTLQDKDSPLQDKDSPLQDKDSPLQDKDSPLQDKDSPLHYSLTQLFREAQRHGSDR